MRYLLSLLIIVAMCSSASAQEWYVNAGDTVNAKNQVGYGTSPLTPNITPSYTLTKIADGDTINLYGYRVPTDTNNYYLDALYSGNKSYFINGVSINGDSPAFFCGLNQNYSILSDDTFISIKGIRFSGPTKYYYIWFNNSTPVLVSQTIIDGCIFDTSSTTMTEISDCPAGAIRYNNATSNQSNTNTLTNSTFFRRAGPVVNFYYPSGLALPKATFYISNVSFIQDSTAFRTYTVNNANGCTVNVSNCIINADTLIAAVGVTHAVMVFNFSYCDTFGMINNVVKEYSGHNIDNLVVNFDYPTMQTGDPLFTTPLSRYGYLQDSSPCLTTGSTSGLIGVLWGYGGGSPTPPSSSTTLYYTQPFITRWREIMWRGL